MWVSSAHAKLVARAGHKIVHAPSDYFYLGKCLASWQIQLLSGLEIAARVHGSAILVTGIRGVIHSRHGIR